MKALLHNGSPFGDPGPHGDLFGDWVPFLCFGSLFFNFRLKNAKYSYDCVTVDESHHVMKVIKWWKLSSGESYKVIKWWKLSSNESFFVMKLIWWWKLFSDESYLVMKVKEDVIVLKSDGWWRFACGDV